LKLDRTVEKKGPFKVQY